MDSHSRKRKRTSRSPYSWIPRSSWRYQINALAEQGYHVVAPDLRGYGDSDSPSDPALFTIFHVVGDLIGLLDVLGQEKAYVVGHDWGAEIAWHLCLFRPERVKALVTLSVPYRARSPVKPVEFLTKLFGEGFYVSQFQEPGRTEGSFSKYDSITILKKLLQIDALELLASSPGVEIIDFLVAPSSLPPWITEEELQFRTNKFERSEFTGALNYYRCMDKNRELLGAWQGAKISVPTKFIVGNKDGGFESFGTKEYVEGEEFKSLVPNMEVVILDGHHFLQQERPYQITVEMLSFFSNH